ncbi:hypothetical protein HGRIS_009381 [Hohenbuehelia grisea]|uniref:Uncharacterized protein n=1 Tax=Hohenbuehelia grisea TaxID=104357 RepID=A0ABR3J130_9AGAR
MLSDSIASQPFDVDSTSQSSVTSTNPPTFSTSSEKDKDSRYSRQRGHLPQRSFTVALRKLPKDFSTLIRSRSSSRTNPFREPELSRGGARLLLETEYTDDLVAKSCKQDIVVRPMDMFSTGAGDRPSRATKSERKLYSFLQRSHSPSQSRSRASSKASARSTPPPHAHTGPLPSMPVARDAAQSQRPTSSVMSSPSSTKTAKPAGTKPSTRHQSRPISSTTTATNTTITPRTPTSKSKKPQPDPLVIVPGPSRRASPPSRPSRDSRRPSPKPSGARKKLEKLFGIGGSRKSSRASSPTSTAVPGTGTAPPLPNRSKHDARYPYAEKPDIEPLESATTRSISRSQTTDSHQSDSGPKRTPSGSRLARFFSGRSSSRPRPSLDSQLPHSPTQSAVEVSGPKAKSHRRSTQGGSLDAAYMKGSTGLPAYAFRGQHAKAPAQTSVTIQSPELIQRVESSSMSAIPKIMHTPATPVKSTASPRRPPGAVRKDSTDSQGSKGWHPMAMVDEEGRLGLESVDQRTADDRAGRGVRRRDREYRPSSSSGGHTPQMSARSPSNGRPRKKASHIYSHGTKHGSFDFERPGWSAGGASGMVRSVSGGSTSGGSALSGDTGPRAYTRSKDSLVGGGTAGVGSQSRSTSTRRTPPETGILVRRNSTKGKQAAPPESDHTGSSTHTSASGGTGFTSSFGRSSGKRITGGITRLFGGGGGGASHGLFSFEPPVPSPAVSGASTQSSPNIHPHGTDVFAREQRRVLNDAALYRERGREMHPVYDRAPVPIPIPPESSISTSYTSMSAGHRSGTKGRSLDLGLGLSWAPSKVRENALLPFGRSLSLTRRGENGGHGKPVSPVEEEPSADLERDHLTKVGRDVAELFRNTLDEEGYATFKKYVHRFDSREIPFDGPSGIIARVDRLLKKTPYLSDEAKQRLLDHFVRVLLQNA